MFGAGVALSVCILALTFLLMWRRAWHQQHLAERALAALEQDRDAAEERAREAMSTAVRLREMLDALPVPVWRRARGHRITDCNRAYAATFGEGEARLARRCPSPTHVVIDGKRRLLEIAEETCSENEAIGFALDRTELEIARGELRRHVTAHAAVLETLSAAVAIFGPDKRLKFFNSAFAALWDLETGWLETEPLVGDILERLHQSRRFPEYPDFRAFKRERCALFSSLIEPRHELMHLPDGRTLQLTIAPHPFGGLIYVYDDVSDQLALEWSYNTLAAVQRATLDHLFEGIAVYGGDGRLKLHNPAFRALWGLSEADVAGEPHIAQIIDRTRDLLDTGDDWPAKREDMIAQVTSQMLASGPVYRRDGSILQVASVPLPDGEVLLTYLDISDTARIEQALRERNETLETAARLKAEFVGNVSHELRTPLGTIHGFAEILHNQYFGPLNASQLEYSGGIIGSAEQMKSLIENVIELASIEASCVELERGSIDVVEMLRSLLLLIQQRAHESGLQIHLSCPCELGMIEGDERRLKQALFNLLSNSLKFTPPGGNIRIDAERCGSELLLGVTDSAGTDFAASDAAGALLARTRRQTNSRLGLSLVKSLIELHGGRVEFEIGPQSGKVICRLPVIAFAAESAH